MFMRESGEMYLETILVLAKSKNKVRAIDVAQEMGFSKPSVSRALAKLKTDEYVTVDTDGYVLLTEAGRRIAERIYERHILLTQVLMDLGVDRETATRDACKIEHDISEETFEAMKKHIKQRPRN